MLRALPQTELEGESEEARWFFETQRAEWENKEANVTLDVAPIVYVKTQEEQDMNCSKWQCDATGPSHYHVDTRTDSQKTIGAYLWAAAGEASIEEALQSGSVEELAKSTAARLARTKGGMIVVNFNGVELDMEDYLLAYLKSERLARLGLT